MRQEVVRREVIESLAHGGMNMSWMFGKFVSGARSVFAGVRSTFGAASAFVVAVTMGVSTFFTDAIVYAQSTTPSLEVQDSGIDWSSVPGKVIDSLMAPAVAGIGIALSIWVIFAGLKFFRRSAT